MKKIDVVIYGSLSRPMGPAGTMRRILKNTGYFAERGYQMTIYSPDGLLTDFSDIPMEHKSLKNNHSFLLKRFKKFIRENVKGNYLLSRAFYLRDKHNIQSISAKYLLLNREPDMVVFHSLYECYYFLKHNSRNVPVILFFHSDAIPFKMELYNYPKLEKTSIHKKHLEILKYVINRVDKCVFISKTGMDNFKEYYPFVPEKKMKLILNGIEDFTIEEENILKGIPLKSEKPTYRLNCIGTINGRKGQGLICKALTQINPVLLPKLHVTFIGDGSEKETLIGYCKKHNLEKNVSFLGNISNKEIYKYLNQSNIFILMSYNEGLPISIIEAMRSGLPIIATNISGIPELIHTEGSKMNGVLLEPDANQLTTVLNSIESYDWARMGEESKKFFEQNFTFKRMKEEYCDMLDDLIAESNNG